MIRSFSSVISESYHNMIGDDEKKHKYKHEVFHLLQKSYEKIGGIHGNGFKDPDDMVKNIHMWKIHKHQGKVVAATMYKNKNGRKSVAVATDGSEHGKAALGKMKRDDVKHGRTWGEMSGAALSFTKKQVGGDIRPHAIHYHDAAKLHGHEDPIRRPPETDPDVVRHPELKDHFYQRRIGNEWHTKIAVGKPHNEIK